MACGESDSKDIEEQWRNDNLVSGSSYLMSYLGDPSKIILSTILEWNAPCPLNEYLPVGEASKRRNKISRHSRIIFIEHTTLGHLQVENQTLPLRHNAN